MEGTLSGSVERGRALHFGMEDGVGEWWQQVEEGMTTLVAQVKELKPCGMCWSGEQVGQHATNQCRAAPGICIKCRVSGCSSSKCKSPKMSLNRVCYFCTLPAGGQSHPSSEKAMCMIIGDAVKLTVRRVVKLVLKGNRQATQLLEDAHVTCEGDEGLDEEREKRFYLALWKVGPNGYTKAHALFVAWSTRFVLNK